MGGKSNKESMLLLVNTGKTPYLKEKIWNGKLHLFSVFHIEK